MDKLNEVIAKSIELNNAIKKLNKDTKVINSIVAEKRNARKENIVNDLQKYIDIMAMLDINVIEFQTNSVMYYNELNRLLGIKIRRHSDGVQIDLGCYSNAMNGFYVMNGFYAFHSIGWVVSGRKDEEIMNGFCDNWNNIKGTLDNRFAEAVEVILESRKEKAIANREYAIGNLTAISR